MEVTRDRTERTGQLRASLRSLVLGALLSSILVLTGCQSTDAGLERDDAHRVARQALQEQPREVAPRFALVDTLSIVRTEHARMRDGEPAWVVAFSRPPSSEIGCVWVSRPDDDYAYEIARCPDSFENSRPEGLGSAAVEQRFELAFATCRAAEPRALAVAYGVPAAVPSHVVARAVAGQAAGVLDPDGQAYRGCLAGMEYRERAEGGAGRADQQSETGWDFDPWRRLIVTAPTPTLLGKG